jgi:hypothetical protein
MIRPTAWRQTKGRRDARIRFRLISGGGHGFQAEGSVAEGWGQVAHLHVHVEQHAEPDRSEPRWTMRRGSSRRLLWLEAEFRHGAGGFGDRQEGADA